MRRKNTFEDFEELVSGTPDGPEEIQKEKAEDTKPEQQDTDEENYQNIAFDAQIARRKKEPQIPAYGSELFETGEDDIETPESGDYYEQENEAYSDPEEDEAMARYRRHEEQLRRKAEKRRKNRHLGGKILAVIQLILSIAFMGFFMVLDVLPVKYVIILSIILFLLALLCFVSQFGRRVHWIGKIVSLIICLALIVGSVYVAKTKLTLDNVTKVKTYQTDKIVIAVRADDPAQSIEDAADYEFGIMSALDRTKVDLAVTQINSSLKSEINITEFDTYSEQVKALYNGKIDAMIYNQNLDELIEENNPGFLEKVRIIDNFDVETEIVMEDVPDLPITKEPFVVFLSGMDVYGELEQTSRSDVNIIACVNPISKQVLLISIPRDAYVEIPGITYGEKDKLTHAGMYGVQYSMASIEKILDVDISYYVRINFTSLITMVDALGGVDVESDYAFSTYYKQYDADTDTWSYYEYNKGVNHLNGVYALAFARERMNAAGGDYQRARNQQKVIEALLNKLKSPAILTGYTGLLSSLEGQMDTNLSSQQIASLVKMQLNDGAEWNIISTSVYGTSSDEYCASYAEAPLAVEVLDDDSIEAVQEVIAELMAGEVISQPRVTDVQEIYEVDESESDEDYYLNNHADDYEYDDFYWENGGYESNKTTTSPGNSKKSSKTSDSASKTKDSSSEDGVDY